MTFQEKGAGREGHFSPPLALQSFTRQTKPKLFLRFVCYTAKKQLQSQNITRERKIYAMYVVKNALKCIGRSKGRNILIGIIVLVISVSACIGLSIRQAAESAKEESLNGLSVTATISVDRRSMMQEMQESGGFDPSSFQADMSERNELSVEEMQVYAAAESVSGFTYTLTATLNGGDDLEAVTTSDSTQEEQTSTANEMPGGFGMEFGGMGGGMMGGGPMGTQGDFTVVGYSGEDAMTDFLNGTCTLTEGTMFEEGTQAADCIISDELAIYNDLAVGDTIVVENPNLEGETYTLTVTGIYENSASTAASGGFMRGFSTSSDPANAIYMSYPALKSMVDTSAANAQTQTDETTGMESSTAVRASAAGTYSFADVEAYEQFEEEARAMGLSDSYTITSSDLTAFENSLVPLENLSTMAGYFLLVVLAIGAVILIVLNIFNVRERKYEVGVLTAIGMKKSKVAMQFLCEIFVVTLAAVVIGAGIGAVSSVPVTNSLLQNQIQSQQSTNEQREMNFGRGGGFDMENIGAPPSMEGLEMPSDEPGIIGPMQNYVSEISSAMNVAVLFQLLAIGVLLTLLASVVSMIFIMRYEPLKILANRD